MALKTLLVGLGGTGCEVVSRVKSITNTEDPDLQFIGFDTDGDTAASCEGLPIIFTSKEMSVKEYLNDISDWEEWFPDDAILKVRNMVKGAGQCRPLSRLAFTETVSSGRIGKLEQAIRELQISRGNITPNDLRIMIVSSFAGGTGSGMFIQTALFLRDYIRQNYGGEVIIRGLFALPDLFKGHNPSPIQRESMYANAYAALKELNAINEVCLSTDQFADSINMAISPYFDSRKDRRNSEKKPFDFIFFVDDINARGMVLQSPEDYKQLMTTATHMQVYSPITATGASREDNAILTVISGNGKPLYGSVGASKIIYPYKDIVEYCGIKATIESISDSWTVIDREFIKADTDNKKLMLLDPTVEKLNRQEHFITTVKSILDEGNSRLNFISKAITASAEDGRQIDRAEAYYDCVYNFVLDKIKKDSDVTSKGNEAGVTEKQLKNNLTTNVVRCETALKDYLDTINSRITLLRASTVQSIIPDDFTSAINTGSDWNILKLITDTEGRHIVHPLAMRMLLYKLRACVVAELNRATSESMANLKKINTYFKSAYDIKETDIVESAAYRTNKLGVIKKIKFISEYLIKSSAQRSRLDKYRESKMISTVFAAVLTRIDALINQFERLFDSLEDIKAELENEVNILENTKHANTAEPVMYICASPENKRQTFDSLQFNCSDSNENGVYDLIFYSLYASANTALAAARNRSVQKLSEKEEKLDRNMKMSKIFRESVVKRNISDIAENGKDKLDLDVYKAMQKMTSNDKSKISSIIESADDKALPYLKHTSTKKFVSLFSNNNGVTSPDSAYTLTFWGIHSEVEKNILSNTRSAAISDFFKAGASGIIPEVVCDDEYSKYEMSCYKALYCVALSEIPKFVETGDSFGVYYENYASRVNSMISKNRFSLTPHIDIHWHLRSYLPMISAEKNQEDDLRAARGIWLAFIYGGLPEETQKGQKTLYASFAVPSNRNIIDEPKYDSKSINYNGKGVQINEVYELYKALQLDEITIIHFNEVFGKAFKTDADVGLDNIEFTGPRARRFVKKLVSKDDSDRNALNLIARFVGHRKATSAEKRIFVSALIQLIDEFCKDLNEDRQLELRRLIFNASRFNGNRASRASLERFINFDYWEGVTD